MGYSETMCQLCGVSFAIARIRRDGEPTSAAWCYYGSDFVDEGGDDGHEAFESVCEETSGCKLLERDLPFGLHDRHGQEHIAGPGCASRQGYSGHRVSIEEMRGCRAVQCLVKKDRSWQPEADDQEFELESDYFLSGIGDGSPDESALEDVKPVRHGADDLLISNCLWVCASPISSDAPLESRGPGLTGELVSPYLLSS